MLSRLGQYDKIGVQLVMDNITGSGSFDLKAEHSADGRNFLEVAGAANLDINISSVSATALHVKFSYSTCYTPLLGYLLFKMYFSAGTIGAHVRVLVTQRDEGG